METYKDLQKLMNDIAGWSDETFYKAQRNPAILYHLKKEVKELIIAIEEYHNKNTIKQPYSVTNILLKAVWDEYADCMMLLLDSAHHFGLTAERLLYITKKKLEVNRKRKWGKPDCNGVVEHLKINKNEWKQT